MNRKKEIRKYLAYAFLVALSVVFLYPLIFLAANSLRPYINKKPVIFFSIC